METEANYYRHRLQEELVTRCRRNHRYSTRAFAKSLAVDAGTLSRILSGKQVPSVKLTLKIVKGLDLVPEEQEKFLASVAYRQRMRELKRVSPLVLSLTAVSPPKDLRLDLYRILSDWYHFAITELTFVRQFKSSPEWIANALGISVAEANTAVARLLEFKLLRRERGGKLVKTDEQLSSADKHLTSASQKRSQRQYLEKAIDSLENDPIHERSNTAMLMAIDPEKLPAAKKMIQDFNQKLCRFLESGDRTRVYNLSISLYPLQQKPEEHLK